MCKQTLAALGAPACGFSSAQPCAMPVLPADAQFVVVSGTGPAPAMTMDGFVPPLGCTFVRPASGQWAGVTMVFGPDMQMAAAAPGTPPMAHHLAGISSPSSADASAAKLTRGARRRQMQRLRKKVGKLERRMAAAAEMEQAALACDDTKGIPVPSLLIDEMKQYPLPELSIGLAGLDVTVPVCAIQRDLKLEESSDLEVTDVFVPLPCQSKRLTPPEPVKDLSEPEVCEEIGVAKVSDTRSTVRRCVTWPLPEGVPIPTANTFVHFPVHREQPRRRSLSV